MVFSEYVKQRILYYRRPGKNYAEIVRCLSEEGHKATKVGVYKFLRRCEETGTTYFPQSRERPSLEDDNMIVCNSRSLAA